MFEFIDNAAAFFVAGFLGLLIGGTAYIILQVLISNTHYPEWKLTLFAICIALVVSLLPQLSEILLGSDSGDLLATGFVKTGFFERQTDTLGASVIGKILGCLIGFCIGQYLREKFVF
ncbi:hypothetical protein NAE50_001543 [Salmonella enterica]|uniref:hypothetical protein n=1 Tax=Salmonella enterica TaxID=28901 RepID=UPI0009AE7B9E|nr:hypothetical protein [Salmonella enterica]EJG5923170.1 hypothetical protein [Salmonella enterica]ELX2843912.1 hypothetical protein [Salmonella enterica]